MGLLGQGPKTTTTQNTNSTGSGSQSTNASTTGSTSATGATQNNTNGSFSNSSTPNTPDWYKSFLSSIPGQYQSLAASFGQGMNKNLYGAPQQAQFQQGLNQATGATRQQLQSQLASQGALNSGRAANLNTQLSLGQNQQLGQYLASVPGLNAQYRTSQQQGLQGAINGQAGFTSPIAAYGQTQSGTQANQANGTTQQDTNSLQSIIQNILSSNTGNQNGTGTQQTQSNVLGGLLNGLLGAGMQWAGGKFGG